ncbi:MAG: hypothetical protein H6712_21030 [Myxococcales bacterium]|nr:hypothetical protein [Myxococcales bacterium]
MARDGERFRRLRTPATGDLFEHFGVAVTPPLPEEPPPAAVLAAAVCEHCGWYRPLPVRGPCPLCAAPGREGRAG